MAQINITSEPEGMFIHALENAMRGDEIVYHIGPYASGPHKKHALRQATVGTCIIYQRKIGRGQFEYCARKIRR